MTPKEKTPKEAEKLPLRLFLRGRYTKEQVIEIFESGEKRRIRMSFLIVDINELRKQWMKLYINLMSLKSHNLIAKEILANHQQKFAETNEYMMEFFDNLGAE